MNTPTQHTGGESATPRTDAHEKAIEGPNPWSPHRFGAVPASFARQLERETATLHAQIARLKQREGELEMLLEGGAGRIARERHRHVTQEGYDAAHDDEHTYGTIRVVAAMLACNGTDASVSDPLDRDDWNLGRHPLERRLEIAGALLAAELDRLARAVLASLGDVEQEGGEVITRFSFTKTPHWVAVVTFFGWLWLCFKPGQGPQWWLCYRAPALSAQAYRAMRDLLQNPSP